MNMNKDAVELEDPYTLCGLPKETMMSHTSEKKEKKNPHALLFPSLCLFTCPLSPAHDY